MVFDVEGRAIFWLGPNGCSAGAIEDSHTLWDRIWRNREIIGGVAHTHPWEGQTHPSNTDETTFAAIEAGLGKRLLWPIVTMTHVCFFCHNAVTEKYVPAGPIEFRGANWWIENVIELRRLSKSNQ